MSPSRRVGMHRRSPAASKPTCPPAYVDGENSSFKICTYMFKAIHGLGPEYINCFVERYMPVRALRSSCNGILLKVTVPRKTIGQSSFSVAGTQMWNDLPIDVRSAQSLMMFRKHLKTYLFRRHYLA